MTDPETIHGEIGPVYRELMRIFGDEPPPIEGKEFLWLPLVNRPEFLDFLRTIPAGTSWRDLTALAASYSATRTNRP